MEGLVFLFIFVSSHICSINSYGYYNIYCGRENCYDVLNVTRDSTKSEISRRFRRMALKYHPDRNSDPDAKAIFTLLNTAYDTLKDEATREEYNYFLDHPEQRYRNYYMYYQRSVQNYVDIRLVVVGLVVVISIFQHILLQQNYERAIQERMQDPKLHHLAKQQISIKYSSNAVSGGKKKKYIEIDDDEYDKILESLVKETYYVKHVIKKPTFKSLLIYQTVTMPYFLSCWLFWKIRWFYRYTLRKMPYSEDDQAYLTRHFLKMNSSRWNSLSGDERLDLIHLKLWIPKNLQEYNQTMEDYAREQLSKDNKHKIVKRYLRRNQGEQIQLDI